ncbi:MAG: hypothetical protein JWQ06_2452 [Mucilaginibacter sp.]|nr:hypothetical protein [Mucilaginibacter sp.]
MNQQLIGYKRSETLRFVHPMVHFSNQFIDQRN